MKIHLWLTIVTFSPDLFLMAWEFPKNLSLNLHRFGINSWEMKLSCFFVAFHTLLRIWWIAISKLIIFIIFCILTHESWKSSPKLLSHMIMSKVLPIDLVTLWIVTLTSYFSLFSGCVSLVVVIHSLIIWIEIKVDIVLIETQCFREKGLTYWKTVLAR